MSSAGCDFLAIFSGGGPVLSYVICFVKGVRNEPSVCLCHLQWYTKIYQNPQLLCNVFFKGARSHFSISVSSAPIV